MPAKIHNYPETTKGNGAAKEKNASIAGKKREKHRVFG
jgi:hypothetical protein